DDPAGEADALRRFAEARRSPAVSGVWTDLSALDTPLLAGLIRNERAQIVALILSRLTGEAAARLLRNLPPALSIDAMQRLLHIGEVHPAAMAGLEQYLQGRARALSREGGQAGAERIARIFDRLDPRAGTLFLAALETAEVDLIVVIGGASVGDHDRVKPAARELGARMRVEGIAMRPGKPLWAAILPDGRRILGLPGNPVSALVCGELFLKPLLAAMQGGVALPETETMPLAEALPANGPREHWMRAARVVGPDGRGAVRALPDQDSAMLTVLSGADGLIRRAANAPQVGAGEDVEILPLG
ncbi:MAG: hypothetical protein B7Z42_05830, partial [Brevundimonas sp. 12-68-7]